MAHHKLWLGMATMWLWVPAVGVHAQEDCIERCEAQEERCVSACDGSDENCIDACYLQIDQCLTRCETEGETDPNEDERPSEDPLPDAEAD